MKTLNIIDSFGIFFRLFYAMSALKSAKGKPSGMISGFANFIFKLKSEFASDYIVFALDSGGATFRSQIDPNYKQNRQSPPPALKEQLSVCIQMISDMGFASMGVRGYEADDIIASFVREYKDKVHINILTHDKDLYQLISENVNIISPASKTRYDRAGCYEKYGVYPEQMGDFLAITGDSADNIPGVKGIGDKGAKNLLKAYGSLENIYANVDKIANERNKNSLITSKDNAFLSRKLVQLYNELTPLDLELCTFPSYNPLERVIPVLREYSLNKLLASLSKGAINDVPLSAKNVTQNSPSAVNAAQSATNHSVDEPEFILITDEAALNDALNGLRSESIIAFDTKTSSKESREAKIVGFSFARDLKRAYYVPMAHNYLGVGAQISFKAAKSAIKRIFSAHVVGHNLRYDFEIVRNNFDIEPSTNYADTLILAWLENPELSASMDNVAKRLFNYETIKFDDVVAKGDDFSSVELEMAAKYAAQDAYVTFRFYEHYMSTLPPSLLEIARAVEYPFIRTLFKMQSEGIKLNIDATKCLLNSLQERIRALSSEIYALANESFNLNSPKQLGVVLFQRLGLLASKKTKTGYSTDESVLLSLKDAHEIVPKILEYRELFKLASTYCEPLIALASKSAQSRVYTSFMQTGTATGRLSSASPNLQNIPARGALAKQMRSCFIARDGYTLASLDYSQIELRLLAHFSADPALIAAFNNGEDIHARTAISVFGSSDGQNRAIAKSINFGLIYGMGARRLAEQLEISNKDAKDYIERYFAAFGTVKDYLASIKTAAHKDGFVSTLLGRRRVFDFSIANQRQIAMYEREAVNTVFQGSAADIIKLAMNKIYPLLNDDVRLILQIHDELIFELRPELANSVLARIQGIMQDVCALKVPLVTSLSVATNWGALK